MRQNPKYLLLAVSLYISLQLLNISLAHENQLSGLLYFQPQTPLPNQAFKVTFELYDPEGKFIPDAILDLSIPDLGFQQSFTETAQIGIYEMHLKLPEGTWFSDLTEATFDNESNTVQFGLKVGEENLDTIEILFPAIEARSKLKTHILAIVLSLFLAGIMVGSSYFYKKYTLSLTSSFFRISPKQTHT